MLYELPYSFVLKELFPVRPIIKKMLGGHLLYAGGKLILFLRERDNQPEFNGVFIANKPEHFGALKKKIHDSKMEFDLDGTKDSWIFISEDLVDFEEKVKKACLMVKNGDERIGR